MKTRILLTIAVFLVLISTVGIEVHAGYSAPPSWSPMTMLNVTFENGVLSVVDQSSPAMLALDTYSDPTITTGSTGYGRPNFSATEYGNFNSSRPWKVLKNTAFSRRLGWYDPNANKTDGTSLKDKIEAAYGAGAAIWIEALSRSQGLETYLAVGKFGVNADNSETVDSSANGYTGIFGTDGSSTKWKWDYKMDHNTYAVSWDGLAANQQYQAVYHVYVGDSQGNKIGSGATETWTWQAPAIIPSLVDKGNGLIYDKDLDVTWHRLSSGRLWTDGSLSTRISTYLAKLNAKNGTGWRLPTANKTDIENGIYNTGELGHLYYKSLGNVQAGGLQHTGPFIGLKAGPYWTGTIASDGMMKQYYVLDFNNGAWLMDCGMISMSEGAYVLAVHDGNVADNPDTEPPRVGTFVMPARYDALTVPVTSFTATDKVGVTGYLLTETWAAPDRDGSDWSSTKPTGYTFDSPGIKHVYGWAKDVAGNISPSKHRKVVVDLTDRTIPVVTGFQIPAESASLTVPVTSFTATDKVGVTGYLLTESAAKPNLSSGWTGVPPESYTFKKGGKRNLYAWARDGAGNISKYVRRQVVIKLPAGAGLIPDYDEEDEQDNG